MLKVAKDDVRDGFEESVNAVILVEELLLEQSNGETCDPLIWGKKFTCTEREKVIKIAKNLGLPQENNEGANWLMAVMALETGGTFDPSIRNSLGYTGLIQFGGAAAKDLSTTTDKLRKMTVVEQLDYVEKYFNKYKSKLKTITDVYLAVLYPKASGHGEEKNYVVFDDSKKAYKANPTFHYEDDEVDKNSNGKIIKRHGKTGGKTYIWEVKMAIQTWYSKGTAKKNTCKTDASTCEFGTSAGELKEEETPGYWNIYVSAHEDRAANGKGIAVLADDLGKEIFRLNVLLLGSKGRDRMKTDNDTPTGVYDIPDNYVWIAGSASGEKRKAYGPNHRLVMVEESGEIKKSGRSLIRMHGGRQENYGTNPYTPLAKPKLNPTNGCIRAFDTDMIILKEHTDKDKEKINLIFQGNCKKSPYQASACQAVIKTEDWKSTADLKVQDSPALLEDSTIMCSYGGAPIKITDHLQVNNPGELQPVAAPVIAPIEEPTITIKWKDELYVDGKGMKKSNKEVEETSDKKAWLEATTLNILPGEEIEFEVDKEEQDKN